MWFLNGTLWGSVHIVLASHLNLALALFDFSLLEVQICLNLTPPIPPISSMQKPQTVRELETSSQARTIVSYSIDLYMQYKILSTTLMSDYYLY